MNFCQVSKFFLVWIPTIYYSRSDYEIDVFVSLNQRIDDIIFQILSLDIMKYLHFSLAKTRLKTGLFS